MLSIDAVKRPVGTARISGLLAVMCFQIAAIFGIASVPGNGWYSIDAAEQGTFTMGLWGVCSTAFGCTSSVATSRQPSASCGIDQPALLTRVQIVAGFVFLSVVCAVGTAALLSAMHLYRRVWGWGWMLPPPACGVVSSVMAVSIYSSTYRLWLYCGSPYCVTPTAGPGCQESFGPSFVLVVVSGAIQCFGVLIVIAHLRISKREAILPFLPPEFSTPSLLTLPPVQRNTKPIDQGAPKVLSITHGASVTPTLHSQMDQTMPSGDSPDIPRGFPRSEPCALPDRPSLRCNGDGGDDVYWFLDSSAM